MLLYSVGAGPLRKRLTDEPFSAGRAILFCTGMCILTLMFSTDILLYVTYLTILRSALLMWWPVMNPLPQDFPRLGFKGQPIYLVVLLFAHNLFSSIFSYTSDLIYPWYADAPRVFDLSRVQDQNIAGVLIRVVYMTALQIAAVVVFTRWFEEGRAQARETRVLQQHARLREASPHE
jgi:putative membrane protein